MAMGMVWGRKLDTANLARLVDNALAILAEFGEPGSDVHALLDGPLADPTSRAHGGALIAARLCEDREAEAAAMDNLAVLRGRLGEQDGADPLSEAFGSRRAPGEVGRSTVLTGR